MVCTRLCRATTQPATQRPSAARTHESCFSFGSCPPKYKGNGSRHTFIAGHRARVFSKRIHKGVIMKPNNGNFHHKERTLTAKSVTKKTNKLTPILCICLSICFCFIIAELVLRIIKPQSPPGTTYGKPVYRNIDHFRDRDFVIPKPENTQRILVLGDSFTWGIGLDVNDTIPKLMEKTLNAQLTTSRVEVINAAIPGFNTVKQLRLLKNRGLKYEPDIIVLIYYLNDIEYLPELSSNATKKNEEKSVPIVEIDPGEDITKFSKYKGVRGFILQIQKYSALVDFLVPRVGSLLRRAGVINSVEFSWVEKIFQGFVNSNPGWVESKIALLEMAAIAKKGDTDFIVAVYPALVELDNYKGKEAHLTIQNYCNEIAIHCVDLLELFENTNGMSYWINFADSHPNANAHRLVVEYLLPTIRNYLI